MWTIHCWKLNSPKHRLNTKSQSLSGSSFFNTQNAFFSAHVGAVLHLLQQILWCKQVRRVGNGHSIAVTWCCREWAGRLYQTWNKSTMVEVAIKWLCWCCSNFFPRTCCVRHKQHDNRGPDLFKKEFRCTEIFCSFSKTYCCYDVTSNKPKFSSKRLNKRVLEQSGDGTLEKYCRFLNEKVNVTANKSGFRLNNYSVANYEQLHKSLTCFCPKQRADNDGIHTQLPDLYEIHSFFIL